MTAPDDRDAGAGPLTVGERRIRTALILASAVLSVTGTVWVASALWSAWP